MASREIKKTGRYKTSTPLTAGRAAERKRRAPVREALRFEPSPVEEIVQPTLSPIELYRLEKAKRAQQQKDVIDPLAKAKAEYRALLESEANAAKGGRPRKNKAQPAAQAEPDAEDDVEAMADEVPAGIQAEGAEETEAVEEVEEAELELVED